MYVAIPCLLCLLCRHPRAHSVAIPCLCFSLVQDLYRVTGAVLSGTQFIYQISSSRMMMLFTHHLTYIFGFGFWISSQSHSMSVDRIPITPRDLSVGLPSSSATARRLHSTTSGYYSLLGIPLPTPQIRRRTEIATEQCAKSSSECLILTRALDLP